MSARTPRRGVVIVLKVFLALLLALLGVAAVTLWFLAAEMAAQAPEAAHLRWPVLALSWVVLAQAGIFLLVLWRLASLVSRDTIFDPASLKWVNSMKACCVLAAVAICGIALLVPGSFLVALALLVGIFVCLGLAVLLEVMRGLLALASEYRTELDGVI